jgi:ligand-binding sensor domain-containing protein/signal transduction histidine kinase
MSARVLLVIIACVRLFPLSAQDLQFRHLKVEDGLSQNTINCIYQDQYGFMWFGTQDGLNCYDGIGFEVFRHDPDDSTSLSHNWIWDILEDGDHKLWVATWDGLSCFNRLENTFTSYFPDSSQSSSISGTRPASLVRDAEGMIWIGTWGGGLNVLDSQTGIFTKFRDSENPGMNYPGDYVRKVFIDCEGVVWIGTWNGLWECRTRTDGELEFRSYAYDPTDPQSISSNRVSSIEEDGLGRLWIGTLGGGLNLLDRSRGSFTRFQHEGGISGSISSNDITFIENSVDGSLWIGTVSDGLNLFNEIDETFTTYHNIPGNPASLASENVYSLYSDRGGLFWVGAGGLNIYDKRLARFSCSGPIESLTEELGEKSVYVIFEDSRGFIWAGSHNQGLVRLDPEKGTLSWYRHLQDDANSLSHDGVSAIAEDSSAYIWIATSGGGLNMLDPRTGKWMHIKEQTGRPETAGLNHISGIVVDEEGIIWIATTEYGIICYNPLSKQFSTFRNDPGDMSSLSGNYLLRIYKDSQGDIWLGSWGGGLNRYDRENNCFERFMYHPDNPASLPGNIVHSISEQLTDSCRLMWIGTASGLASLNPDDPEAGFALFPKNGELPSLSVYGTLFDKKNNLWISTNSGITFYQDQGIPMKHYNKQDGLPGNEFNAGAFLELSQGQLAFGGINGLLVFHPDSVEDSSYEPQVVFTSFSVMNEQVYDGFHMNAIESLTLPYKQNFFSFEFASMDFSDPENNCYMYKLEGIDEEWIDAGRRNFASYTKIDPGEYIFRVRATNSDRIWSSKEASIALVITPPFWQRWWFRTMGILLLLLAFYAIDMYRIQRVREIERLRTRIASDLHDDIGSALTRISVHSQQILTQKDLGRIEQSSAKINELSREMVSTMSDIVWSIDARNDTLADFLSRMQDLTHQLFSERDISVSFVHKGMESRRTIKVQVRQNLYYIFKEALNNIARHSGADRVEISMNNSDSRFRMHISDNGAGYDPANIEGGNGLRNMKMRAERIGATLEIISRGGVEISLEMKGL